MQLLIKIRAFKHSLIIFKLHPKSSSATLEAVFLKGKCITFCADFGISVDGKCSQLKLCIPQFMLCWQRKLWFSAAKPFNSLTPIISGCSGRTKDYFSRQKLKCNASWYMHASKWGELSSLCRTCSGELKKKRKKPQILLKDSVYEALWFFKQLRACEDAWQRWKYVSAHEWKLCIFTCVWVWVTAVSGPSDRDPCECWIVLTAHWGEGAGWLLWTSDLWPPVSELRHP